MIDHVSVGVRDIGRSKRFYDAALGPLSYTCLSEGKDSLGYGKDRVAFWATASDRPVAAEAKSGLHFCFNAPTRASVDDFHAAAPGAGGNDNGKPGLRIEYAPDYYAAFVIDPDWYRVEAYCTQG